MKEHQYKSEYQALINARSRCTNPNVPCFADYGGRGIKVHPDWCGRGGFDRFLAHIGPKPSPSLTLDRLDNDKGYEPGNVAWRSRKDQMANRRPTRRHVHYTVRRIGNRNAVIKAARASGVKVPDIALCFDLSSVMVYKILKSA